MRLLIDAHHQCYADRTCRSAREGQRALNESFISILYLGQQLEGRGTGLDVLVWAKQRDRLPPHITLVSANQNHRRLLSDFLVKNGYVGDGIFFHRQQQTNKSR